MFLRQALLARRVILLLDGIDEVRCSQSPHNAVLL
jgi:hypothetical protein